MAESSVGHDSMTEDDDIPLPEFLRMVAAVVLLVATLIFVEIIYRWLVKPANTLLPLQLLEAWIWTSLSNLFWPGSAELVQHSSGVLTQVDLIHPTFYDGHIPLYVSDECAGVHEIVFLGAMILLTPGLRLRDKMRHVGIAAAIILTLNMCRLLVLHPLAVRGCADSAGLWGCDAPLWRFHEFILSYGFLIALVVGWTIWFRLSGGQRAVARFWKRLPDFRGISVRSVEPTSLVKTENGSSSRRLPIVAMGATMAVWMVIIVTSQSYADTQALAAGCGSDYTTRCSNIIDAARDSAGRVWRGALLSFVLMIAPLLRLETRWSDEED